MSGGTTTGSGCLINGDWLSCPAGSDFKFNGNEMRLNAYLQCPLNSVSQSQFVEASQQGLCQCDSALQAPGKTADEAEPIDCECFACPVGSEFGFSYECNRPILFNCLTFNCFGECNGAFNAGLNKETDAPTAAPTPGSSAMSHSPMSSTSALVVLVVMKMLFR